MEVQHACQNGSLSLSLSDRCNTKPNTTVPSCTPEEQDHYEGSGFCGLLLDRLGPFAVCHSKVNPNVGPTNTHTPGYIHTRDHIHTLDQVRSHTHTYIDTHWNDIKILD